MLCAKCGTETVKSFDIKSGQQVAVETCPICNTSSGSTVVVPNVSTISEPSMTANAQMTRVEGSTAHAPNPIHIKAEAPKTGLLNKASQFTARLLNRGDSRKYDQKTADSWMMQQNIVPKHATPPGSGLGYKVSPYTSEWIKLWGITPIADLSKYRLMYRTVPKVKRAIDKTVSSAIIKGFNRLEINPLQTWYPEDEYSSLEDYHFAITSYLQSWIDGQDDFYLNLNMIGKDMLIYGNAYVELVYEDLEVEEKQSNDFTNYEVHKEDYSWAGQGPLDGQDAPMVTMKNPGGKYLEVAPKGDLIWLKPLDPLYMRVRADSYGNVFGYLQFLSAPPVSYTPDKMAHFRYNPLSWQYETFNGTSMLMSIIRTQEIIWQIENDLILLGHATVKPPMHFACGDKDNIWPEPVFTQFIADTANRSAGGDLYTRGDVKGTPLPAPAGGIPAMVKYLDYHDTQRTIALGVPPQLLGQPEGSSRTTAEVSLDDWVNMLQNIQREISNTLEDQIFRHIIKNKFGEDAPIPKPVWNPLFDKNENDITSRIVSLVASGIVTLNEGRNWLSDIGIKLAPVEGGEKLQDLERFKQELENSELMTEQSKLTLEQTKQELESPPEGVEAAYENESQKWLNLKQKDVWKEHDHAPGKGPDILANKYKLRETLKINGISVFAVNDKNIKLNLNKDWNGSGSSIDYDFIDEDEIWLSDNYSQVQWAEKLEEEQKKIDVNLNVPMKKDLDDIKTKIDQISANQEVENKFNARKLDILEKMV